MFDKTNVYVQQHLSRSSNVNVTEKRAPTDESIRLLREMEQKIESDWLKRVPLEINGIKMQFFKSYDVTGVHYCLAFNINGKNHLIKVDELYRGDDLIEHFYKEVSNYFAVLMIESMSREDMKCLLS